MTGYTFQYLTYRDTVYALVRCAADGEIYWRARSSKRELFAQWDLTAFDSLEALVRHHEPQYDRWAVMLRIAALEAALT